MKWFVSLCFCATLFVSLSAEDIRNRSFGYTIKPSQGWSAMEAQEFNGYNKPSSKVKFDYGFKRDNPLDFLTYILVRTLPENMSRYSFDDLEEMLHREMNLTVFKNQVKKENVDKVVMPTGVGQAVLDRQKKRFVFELDMKVMGIVDLRCMGIGLLSKDGITLMYCYCSKAAYEKQAPLFLQFADGIHFDADRQFQERVGFFSGVGGNNAISGGVIGALVGLGVAFAIFVVKKVKGAMSGSGAEPS